MLLRLFGGIPACFAFAAVLSYVVIGVCMLLSRGMLEVRTEPAWAHLTGHRDKPPTLWAVTIGSIAYDWLHARLLAGPISLAISAIAGLCACLLTTEVAVPSKRTFSQVLSSMTTNANKSLRRSFCSLLGSYALTSTDKLR